MTGFASTYIRFYPHIKKNYDYGVVVFLLTFNLITVSSYRVQNVFHLAQQRLYTIAIGCSICLAMSFLILPCWSGEDLHRSTVYKLEGLARSIEACVNEYFKDNEIAVTEEAEASNESIQKGYRAVLDSKSSEESLAHFASWEPRFSRQCHKYPWHLYVKIGAIMRHFAYTAAALHGCLESQIQTPQSVRSLFRDPCTRVAREVSTVLLELSTSIENRRRLSPDSLTDNLQEALQALNSAIKSQPRLFLGSNSANRTLMEWKYDKENSLRVALSSARTDASPQLEFRNKKAPDHSKDPGERRQLRPSLSKLAITSLEFSEALPFAAFASLLVEMVARLDLVIQEVEELGRAANFKELPQKDDTVIDISDNGKKSREGGREMQEHHASQDGE
ncbi:aluminum-activated malate transporter 12-like [Iris pallida]|uniref:Aluminum-activated malate transporter 12-like n=1 Tax=Iris pallida TaxID=29817 RepID=A0AAX6IEC1_IRIPA|nr:aluminum-activated malate transporter 12-like [Iris pallida]